MKQHIEIALPIIDEDELNLVELPHISMNAMNQWYSKIGMVANELDLYRNNVSLAILAGKQLGDEFIPVVSVTCKIPNYLGANIPTQLDNWVQVSMVTVDKQRALEGYTKATYEAITKHFDLVSDRKQYWAAKKLWQSLARNSAAHIFVFDGTTQDYVRDADGKPHKYDGKNIPENTIWGKSIPHAKRLLVATRKNLV